MKLAVIADGTSSIESIEGRRCWADRCKVYQRDVQGIVGGDKIRDDGRFGVELANTLVFGKGISNFVDLAIVPLAQASINTAHRKGLGGVVCGNAKIVLARFHREPEVAVVGCIGIDEGATSENQLSLL